MPMTAPKDRGVVDIAEVPRGRFGKCPCGQPTHNMSDFVDREILIESFRRPQDFTVPVVIINLWQGDELHSAYTFSKVIQRQLEEAGEILAKGSLIRARLRRVRRGTQSYLTLV